MEDTNKYCEKEVFFNPNGTVKVEIYYWPNGNRKQVVTFTFSDASVKDSACRARIEEDFDENGEIKERREYAEVKKHDPNQLLNNLMQIQYFSDIPK